MVVPMYVVATTGEASSSQVGLSQITADYVELEQQPAVQVPPDGNDLSLSEYLPTLIFAREVN